MQTVHVDGLDEMQGEACFASSANILIHSKPAQGNSRPPRPPVKHGHDLQPTAIRQTEVREQQIKPIHRFNEFLRLVA